MCRTASFSKSFLPNMAREWNDMKLYCYGVRQANIQLTRMRVKCSSLNAHLCFYLAIVNDDKCSCGYAEVALDDWSGDPRNFLRDGVSPQPWAHPIHHSCNYYGHFIFAWLGRDSVAQKHYLNKCSHSSSVVFPSVQPINYSHCASLSM
jgi:hypothetical protein